ncbi:unnamed protein product [Schistosoma bovis]|nr:unnamed protein product [Schistosoma bovis]CAH8617828.1 unnamed protein product [Schistosoma haematobium]CAH8625638.1 unnamed protein product [Schistosoma haematobium]
MKLFSSIFVIVLVFSLRANYNVDACKAIGETCAKTIFDRCCDGSVCKLSAPFYGECVECLTSGNRCWKHSECCSGYCNWFTCRDL